MARLSRAFFRTTVVRLALIYIGVFALTTAALFSSVYVLTLRAVDDGTEELMESQLQGLSEQYATLGLRGLVAVVRARSQSLNSSRSVYLLADESLRPLAGNLNAWPQLNNQRGKWFEFNVTVQDGQGGDEHPIRAALVTLPEGYRLLIGTDVIERARLALVMQRAGALALALSVLIGAVIAVWMNRRLLNQVHAIASAGQDIAKGDFARRLPISGSGDELDELATDLNALLERIEQLTLALRFVIDGTAHDLRGPLNRMRMRLEQALEQAPADGRVPIEAAMQDADALLRTLEALLRIAQAQSGAANAEIAVLNLGKLVSEIAELYAPLAEQRGIRLELPQLDAGAVQGSRQLLAHAVANLLDNAVKYTPPGGCIIASVQAESSSVVLRVSDNGPGIPAADRERVLQRFVRLDSAQAEPGTGLGLSLVAAVCRFHHAELSLEDASPGLAVRLSFRPAP
ncbi:MAG: ATP-binding protein [Steroidobacteraceae bacterium]